MKSLPALIELDAEFAEWLISVYDRRWTGEVLLKFNRGMPQMVAMPSIQVRFDKDRRRTGLDIQADLLHSGK